MSLRRRILISAIVIIVITALAVIVDIPKGPDISIGQFQRELKVRLGLDLRGGASLTYEADTSQVEEADRAELLEGLKEVIEQRINQFGVSEPSVRNNKVGDGWRIIVELPGITDINEAIAAIGETPLLEFREEGKPPERTEEEKNALRVLNEETKKRAEEILQQALSATDFAALAKEKSEDPGSAENGGDLDFFGKGIMDPAFETAVFEAEVGKVMPQLVQSSFGYHIVKVTEKRTQNEQEEVRASHILLRTIPEEIPETGFPFYENTGLNGQQLERAQVTFDQQTGASVVSLQFNAEGAKLFKEITERNIGKTVAIYLDNAPISIPTVNQVIPDGQAIIEGNFTLEEAKELTRRLNAGALPVPITLVNQQNIGPTLGELAVQKSLFAGIIGLALLIIFMISYYRLPGLLASVALLIYTLIVLAVFKLVPVTLTLAGIAGFILSIGMAVDANILIFERMKEELRDGNALNRAVEQGFRRAWLSIRDSNVSSLITCAILATFSTSLVKGFAITLALGIVVSMFSAITITRTFLRLCAKPAFEKKLWLFGITRRSALEVNGSHTQISDGMHKNEKNSL
ncbi:MAG: protein-export membrane protein SecD [Candidatus Kerfeldbacteria bacterium RIFCSPHIGHO2_02_FULL_42_14]|uniref:Protein translocase subunit SecD n=1 Tax=Candidatus Kerfeldbacteria bacterium RIFCSPHIGHO2_02_FULL_42_14 TaxID=1798540 RepID=A0A1G2ARP9_9BACT|nr:MAG: protein-export membrane protein SecD [Candidatus Kerfeldbacteria bacterium RIFCSPHIGHO2_02_FULL_42_14]OGY81043.1 MAG: protein-export membrane protein SecD [Candidatus Kerfeldbacteria bacterium RIFCSPHIGHO2_12_FULL_42_13]OGY84861.1 MAG: protein-export membrane protein SecD [Candidatus Kerfeldbacteria bacterium RIFCSPLOWO2_02_FULL_42_19]OGY86774.1 MAG: protein-export membrane protein SecD [Candidatus Kerfeldbacteria bacterium RIFCSPLOWO2_12_FULL_43_9]